MVIAFSLGGVLFNDGYRLAKDTLDEADIGFREVLFDAYYIKDELVDILEALSGAGFKTACLTNLSKDLIAYLDGKCDCLIMVCAPTK
jgi:hypothetical protein